MNILKRLEKDRSRYYFIDKESANFIINIIRSNNIKNILEIGTGKAYSTILFAKNCESITSIEKYENQYLEAKRNVEESELSNIKIIFGDALEVLDLINEKFNLIFIDGEKKEYLNYFKKAWDKINDGGFIILDNTLSHRKYLDKFFNYIKPFKYKEINIGKGLVIVNKR